MFYLFPRFTFFTTASGNVNLPPIFTQDMNNLALPETQALNSIVYRLEGYDPEGGAVTFGLVGTENFEVNPVTGDVKLIKQLDREVNGITTAPPDDNIFSISPFRCRHKTHYHF